MSTMTHALRHTFFGLGLVGCLCLASLSGCDRDPVVGELPGDGGGSSQQEGCPAAKPTDGTSCTAPTNAMGQCDYFKEATHCNYFDLYYHCACEAGGWRCREDFEDCPCWEPAPVTGEACSFPGPSTCEYSGGKKCTCDGTSWKCTGQPADNSCPATQPADGASCTKPTTASGTCDYFLAATKCHYLDLYAHCSCESGGWSCKLDHETCPCPASAPTNGEACSFPGPSNCDYQMESSYDGGTGSIKHCACNGKTWQCVFWIG